MIIKKIARSIRSIEDTVRKIFEEIDFVKSYLLPYLTVQIPEESPAAENSGIPSRKLKEVVQLGSLLQKYGLRLSEVRAAMLAEGWYDGAMITYRTRVLRSEIMPIIEDILESKKSH